MFNNIIYIIVILVIFQLNYPGDGFFSSPLAAASILFFLWLIFNLYCKYRFSRLTGLRSGAYTGVAQGYMSALYQSVVTRLSILSIVIFALSVYLLNLKYWFLQIPGFTTLSILPGAAAVALYFAFLATIWYHGYPAYYALFTCPIKRWAYIRSNIKLNIPILFPWAILTLCYDLLALLTWPSLKKVFESEIGQFIFLALFLTLLVIFLPPFIKYFWGCVPLPDTEKKQGIVSFFRDTDFKYRDLLRWPLLEGRVMTAGVMGLLPRFRYILVTDSLLQFLSQEELNAVMAHEIGHIKYRHMLFYVLFLLGYMALSLGLFDVFFYAMATQPGLFALLRSRQEIQSGIFYLVLSLPIIVSVIVYFRYVMGFFMRNFERQADLYSAQLIGTPEPTIMSLEKIASATGQSRHHPSWHHFSIAERVEFLWKSWRDPGLRSRHSKRLAFFLALYFVLLITLGYGVNFGPLKSSLEEIALTRLLHHQGAGPSETIAIYRGLAAVYHQRGNLARATWAYEGILRLNPDDDVALNNFAWILATSDDETLFDYPRALQLAKRAVAIKRSPTFLDTLAEAYYVNGLYDQALDTIREALGKASVNRKYLTRQMKKFEKRATLEEK